jgi:sarcinarray family protein
MGSLISIFSILGLLGILCISPVDSASECDFGSAQAWFRVADGHWENATAHPILQRGEPFDIKIVITVKTELQLLFVKLHEFGTPVYEVVEGPIGMEQLLECRQMISPGRCFTYTWRMRVRSNTTWVNGYAPLEVFVQFNKNDIDEMRISFDVITSFILSQHWKQHPYENNAENMSSSLCINNNFVPYFALGVITSAMGLWGIALFIRKHTK